MLILETQDKEEAKASHVAQKIDLSDDTKCQQFSHVHHFVGKILAEDL